MRPQHDPAGGDTLGLSSKVACLRRQARRRLRSRGSILRKEVRPTSRELYGDGSRPGGHDLFSRAYAGPPSRDGLGTRLGRLKREVALRSFRRIDPRLRGRRSSECSRRQLRSSEVPRFLQTAERCTCYEVIRRRWRRRRHRASLSPPGHGPRAASRRGRRLPSALRRRRKRRPARSPASRRAGHGGRRRPHERDHGGVGADCAPRADDERAAQLRAGDDRPVMVEPQLERRLGHGRLPARASHGAGSSRSGGSEATRRPAELLERAPEMPGATGRRGEARRHVSLR